MVYDTTFAKMSRRFTCFLLQVLLRIVSPILVNMVRLVQELIILTDTNVSAQPATEESTAKTVGDVTVQLLVYFHRTLLYSKTMSPK